MIRRTLLVAAAAAALVLAPSAAMAYDAPGFTSTVSDTTPVASSPVTVTVTGADPDESLTLTVTSDPATISSDSITIAGTKSLAKAANASGVVTYSVTLSAAGTFTLAVTDVSGAVVSTQSLVVAAVVTSGGTTSSAGSQLPSTGFNGMGLVAGAGVLVLVGAGVVLVARRRDSATTADPAKKVAA